MKMLKRKQYLINLIMAACVVMFSLVSIYGFIAIQNKNQFVGTQFNGATWSASSLELEYWRFLHELEEYLKKGTNKEKLLLRFDIFWSRLPVMRHSPETGVLQDLPEYAANISLVEQSLVRIDPVLQALTPTDVDNVQFVRDEMHKLETIIHTILLDTYQVWSDTLTYGEQKINKLRYLLVASFASILFSSFGLITGLVRQLRFGRRMLTVNEQALEVAKTQTIALEKEIDERQQAVAALRDSENRFKDVADIAADWIWELDEQLRCSYLSERYQEITGVEPSKVLGRGPPDFPRWQEQNAGVFERQVELMNNRQVIDNVEMSFTAADGSERKISVNGHPLFANDGRFLGYRGVGRDVTGRVKAEQELRMAKTSAEQANASKSRFLAAASHDLRQPLQTLRLLNSALTQSAIDPQTKLITGKQAAALDSMDRILDVLLDLNRLELGSIQLQCRAFALKTLMDRLDADFRDAAIAKGLAFRQVRCDTWINSDPDLLYTVLHNFVSNALKYTSNGGILIGCRKRGKQLSIEVWDTGVGIPEDGKLLIFEEFYQVDNPARDRRQGLGLGLAIVNRLSGLLGHPVNVRSKVGKGSMFSIQVPRGIKQANLELGPDYSRLPIENNFRVTILCIEDDPAVLESLKILLELKGYTVLSAPNGQIALEVIAGDGARPDIVISDYRLPAGEMGTDVLRQINTVLNMKLPAILITGDTSLVDAKDVQALGCRLLHKPVKGDELVDVIQDLSPDKMEFKRTKYPFPRLVNA